MFIALGAALTTGLATPSVYATTVYQQVSDWSAHEAPGGLGGGRLRRYRQTAGDDLRPDMYPCGSITFFFVVDDIIYY